MNLDPAEELTSSKSGFAIRRLDDFGIVRVKNFAGPDVPVVPAREEPTIRCCVSASRPHQSFRLVDGLDSQLFPSRESSATCTSKLARVCYPLHYPGSANRDASRDSNSVFSVTWCSSSDSNREDLSAR